MCATRRRAPLGHGLLSSIGAVRAWAPLGKIVRATRQRAPLGHGLISATDAARPCASSSKVLRTYPGIPLTHAPFPIN